MKNDIHPSTGFFYLASEQRLDIIIALQTQPATTSNLAKILDVSIPLLHRNIQNLSSANIIKKNIDGRYELTSFGTLLSSHIPSIRFMLKNKEYFSNHKFGNLPLKFIHRLSSLENGVQINGYVNVAKKFIDIHKNANAYLCNILVEVLSSEDFLQTIVEKASNKIQFKNIFSDSAIVTSDRRELNQKFDILKFVRTGVIQRKMIKNADIVITLNEKESLVIFPLLDGQTDYSTAFYSNDSEFHAWCFDYFQEIWKNANSFQESKLSS